MEIINQTQLNECMTGDKESDLDLIRSAIDEIAKRFHEMEISLKSGDCEAWRTAAHRCTGVAATLGFTALADQFRITERSTRMDHDLSEDLIHINGLIDLTRAELLKTGMI